MDNRDCDSNLEAAEVVIIGGGIGGLAFALALHRVGIKAVVLEQSESLRVEGAAIALWTNAFCVLNVLGVGNKFRTLFTNLLTKEIRNSRGKILTKVTLADCDGGRHQLRVVERRILLEILAEELPEGTIHFNSRVVRISKSESRTGITDVQLEDGLTYSAKVVVGFDGINSCVAAWMGLQKAQPVGNIAIRGMADFPEGHKFGNRVQFYVGKGTHTAVLPSSSTKVFWSLVWNDWSEGWRNESGEQKKAEALQRTALAFSATPMASLINSTPTDRIFKSTIRHRLNPRYPELLVAGTVTVAGDAAHPITPDMAQGGCMALEDAIVLTQKLYGALRMRKNPDQLADQQDQKLSPDQADLHENVKGQADQHENLRMMSTSNPAPADKPKKLRMSDSNQVEKLSLALNQTPEHERIYRALVEFQRARHERTSFISTKSVEIGKMMLSGSSVVNFFRDRFIIPLVVNQNSSLAHTFFDVGELPSCEGGAGTCE